MNKKDLLVLGAGSLGSTFGGGFANYMGQKEQASEHERTEKANRKLSREQAAALRAAGGVARGDLQSGLRTSSRTLQSYHDQAMGQLRPGYEQARGDLTGAYGLSKGALGSGYGDAQQSLQQYGSAAQFDLMNANQKARRDMVSGIGRARDTLAGGERYLDPSGDLASRGSRLSALMDQEGGLYGGFKESPGYAFRQQQGEAAVNRSAAGAGGRLGGSTLKALADYNQGLASQEYDAFAQRRLAEANMGFGQDQQTQAARMALYGGRQGLAGMENQQGNALAGMSQQTGARMSDINMQQGGTLANLQTSRGTAMAGLETGHGATMSGLNLGEAQQYAGMTQGLGSNLSNLQSAAANNMAATGLQAAGGAGNLMMQGASAPNPYAGAGWNAVGGAMNQLGSAAMMYGMSQGGGNPYQPDVGAHPGTLNDYYGTPYAPGGYYR